jgi:hypothetical protein
MRDSLPLHIMRKAVELEEADLVIETPGHSFSFVLLVAWI